MPVPDVFERGARERRPHSLRKVTIRYGGRRCRCRGCHPRPAAVPAACRKMRVFFSICVGRNRGLVLEPLLAPPLR